MIDQNDMVIDWYMYACTTNNGEIKSSNKRLASDNRAATVQKFCCACTQTLETFMYS